MPDRQAIQVPGLKTIGPNSQAVTDLMLPSKDGIRLATELLARSSRVKVILISGYTEHGLPDPTSLKEATFLSRPFSRHELIERVASLLDEAQSGT